MDNNNFLAPPPSLDDLDASEITYIDNGNENLNENEGEFTFHSENNFDENENFENMIEPIEIITVPIHNPHDVEIYVKNHETQHETQYNPQNNPPSFPTNQKINRDEIIIEKEPAKEFDDRNYSSGGNNGNLEKYNKYSLFIHQYKYELYCTLNYLLIYFTFGVSLGSIGPALKVLQLKTNTSPEFIGLLFVTRGFGFIGGSIFSGKFIDFIQRHLSQSNSASLNLILRILLMVFSPHRIPAYAIFLCSAAYLWIAFVTNFYLLNFLVFLTGISGGVIDVCNNTFIMWAWKEKSLTFLQFIHFGFGLGAIISGFLFGFLQNFYDEPHAVQIGFIIIAIICFPMGLGIYFIKSPEPAPSTTQIINNDSSDDPSLPSFIDTKTKQLFSEKYSYILVVVLSGLYLFVYVGAESGYAGWIYSYAVDMNWANTMEADYLTSVFWVSFAVFRLVFVFISMKVTASFILICCTVICLSSTSFLAVAQYLFYFGYITSFHAEICMWIATVCFGIGTSACYPSAIGLPSQLGKKTTATSTSVMVFAASAGELVCAVIIAILFTVVSPYTFPIYFAVLSSIGLVIIGGVLFTGNVPLSQWFRMFHSSGSNIVNYSPSGSADSNINIELEMKQDINDDGTNVTTSTSTPAEERTFRKLFNTMKERFLEDENSVDDDDDEEGTNAYDESERKYRIPI